jgi:ribose 5-phosphate isomerase B
MRIAVANDHAGLPLKKAVIEAIEACGHQVLDLGTDSFESSDYPDFAEEAGKAVINGEAERAIVMCGSGVGVNITLNKMKGIYASVCHDAYSAHQGVEHDNMNVLCMGGAVVGTNHAKEIVKNFLNAKLMDGKRFLRRINKFKAIEEEFMK